MGGVCNLLAGKSILAVMPFFNQKPVLVSYRYFRKKGTSGKPFSQMSGYGFNKVSFLFGSCASCMNVLLFIYLFIYLFIFNHCVQISFKLIC